MNMKRIITFLLICLVLGACNYPSSELSSEKIVQTNVALILTNAPDTTLLPDPTRVADTPIPAATEPVFVTLEPQTTTASTPEPTLTATTAPTATSAPVDGDPVATLGEPDFLEDFDAVGNWSYEDGWFMLTVSGGQLHIYSKGTPYWSSWYTTYPEVQDAYFETTITRPNCSGQDRFGLVIRWDASQEFYYMGVTCDGTWNFSRYTKNNQIVNILDYQSSDAFKPASEANRIGIMAKGNQFDFYINGVKVGSATDSSLPDAGTFGFLSMSAGTVNFKTSVDKLAYWEQ